VRQACVARQMPLGIFGVDAAAVQSSIKAGFRLITVGMDTLMLIQSAQAILSALKG
jgi:2-keto-3-deoxy-L-rhamnonate aldolase RhmA